jgi:hypothetical protein
LSGTDFSSKVRQAAGTRLSLTLERHGKPEKISFYLKELMPLH